MVNKIHSAKSNRVIAIIGYGRFGELLAKILQPYGEILVVSNHQVNNKQIKQIAYPDLTQADWIIPAVPISALEATLKKIKPYVRKGSLVMDVSSVKVYPCRWLKKYLPKEVEVIGTHPMFGPDSAKNGLAGLQLVICPLRQSAKTLKEIKAIFKDLQLKIIETTPEEHDRQAALNLGLVHLIGRALVATGVGEQEITTKGYERLLGIYETVNNDTWQLFFDMQNYNPYTKKIRQDLLKSLTDLEKRINKHKIN